MTDVMSAPSRRHVLVVDDDRDIRETLAELLADEGYHVSVAADGLEALRVLAEARARPDLILLDLMMPNMDGFEFRERQLDDRANASIPIAVVSAGGNAKDAAERLRAAGFLQKPVKLKPLLALIEQIVARGGAA